jgi:hypothetical protein
MVRKLVGMQRGGDNNIPESESTMLRRKRPTAMQETTERGTRRSRMQCSFHSSSRVRRQMLGQDGGVFFEVGAVDFVLCRRTHHILYRRMGFLTFRHVIVITRRRTHVGRIPGANPMTILLIFINSTVFSLLQALG